MNGKLNGVTASEDADRLPDHVGVDPARDVLEVRPLHQRRDAGGNLDALDPAPDLAGRVLDRLSVVPGDDGGELVLARLSSRYLSSKHARARSTGGVERQAGKASRAARTAASTSAAPESGTEPSVSPLAGLVTRHRLGPLGLDPASSDEVLQGLESRPRACPRPAPSSPPISLVVEYRRGSAGGLGGSGHPGAGPALRLLRHQSRPPLIRGGVPLRQPAQRLLAPARGRGPDAAPARPERAVGHAGARLRAHERRLPDDEGLERPAPGRLRRLHGAPGAAGGRARTRNDRLRRQVVVSGSVRTSRGASWGCRSGSWARRRSSFCPRRHPRTPPSRTTSGSPGSSAWPSISAAEHLGTVRARSLTFRAPRARFSGLRSKAGGGMGCPG